MATSNEFNKRMEALIRKALLDEYPHMKTSTLNRVSKDGAGAVAYSYQEASRRECAGVRPLKFFDLPREIRDVIYGFAVMPSDGLPILLNDCSWGTRCARNRKIEADFDDERQYAKGYVGREQPAITRVSRQLRREALPLFYQSNDFALCLAPDAGLRTNFWLDPYDASPNEVKHIAGVRLLSDWLTGIGEKNVSDLVKITVHYNEEELKKTILDLNLVPAKYIDFVHIEYPHRESSGYTRAFQDQLRAMLASQQGREDTF